MHTDGHTEQESGGAFPENEGTPESVHPEIGNANFARECALRHYDALAKYAYSICGNRAAALDAVQETFLRLAKVKIRVPEEYAKAWLYRVCRTRVIDAMRKGGNVKTVPIFEASGFSDDKCSPDRAAEKSDTFERIEKAKAGLGERQRELLSLKFDSGLSYKQISEITGIPVSTVGKAVGDAIATLRKTLLRKEA